jgi:phosphoglycolate phosphatase-like HAD superfamily hydrolase
MTTKRLLVLDLDGTLVDSQKRWAECQKLFPNDKRQFWNCFQSERFMGLDTPKENVISYAKSLIDNETVVVIVSGRSERQREKTLEQLNGIGITFNEIYLRKEKDFRKDFQFKGEIIGQLIQKYNPIEMILIDDSDDVLNFVSQNFPGVKVIDSKKL